MTSTQVWFLSFKGCPLAPLARSNLLAAIAELDPEQPLEFEEIDLMSDSTPSELSCWGSATILINGQDLVGCSKGDAGSCRIYASDGGVPTPDEIRIAIKKAGAQ